MTSLVISCIDGQSDLDRAATGVLGSAQRLARGLAAGKHVALVVGRPTDEFTARVSVFAEHVYFADDSSFDQRCSESRLAVLTEACKLLSPHAILFGNETAAQELVPRLAHRLRGSAAGDALQLQVDGKAILVVRSVYGGKALATVALRRMPGVIWIRARAHQEADRLPQVADVTQLKINIPPTLETMLLDRQFEAKEAARLEDARVIVSGGRGLGGPEPFAQLKVLANTIGGQMAASRAACDAGWVPANWQVGQTGKKVAPQLYLAVAISGASQHIMGIADAKTIAAINVDPDAPIFQHCQFGIVDDYRKVVGPLTAKLCELLA